MSLTPETASAEVDSGPWARWGWVMAVIWLGFLFFPISAVWQSDASGAVRTATLGAIAAFGVVYVLGFSVLKERHAPAVLAVMALCMIATLPVIGIEAVAMTPYLGAFSALQVPAPAWKWTTPVTALIPVLSLLGNDFPVFFFILVWPIIGACTIVRVLTDAELQEGTTRRSMALVAERERVARDVHDVLGHSLTALSVKAELAARLIDIDPARAKDELQSIQATARQALAEVRATVGGLRAGNLEAELATLPRVLDDAGIVTSVEGTVADTDPRHRALLAWVLRESVTNVVRHARAGSVVIELGPHGISVTDDGAGCAGAEGNGLRGMRERVAGAGGTLAISAAAPGTRVEVALP